jgi:predicted nucleotidyltransferase
MKNHELTQKYSFIRTLSELPFIEKIILYGSRSRGDHRDRSDIDLAIECPKATNTQWIMQIMKIIENADTLLKIDCVRLDELQEESQFKKEILKDGIIVYQKAKS